MESHNRNRYPATGPLRLLALRAVGRWLSGYLCVAAACLPLAHARDAAMEDVSRVLRFYYLSYASSDDAFSPADARFRIRNAGQMETIAIGPSAFSAPVAYRGPVPVPLFAAQMPALAAETAEGTEAAKTAAAVVDGMQSVGRLDFPASWQGALFLVRHDPAAGALGLRFFPVEYAAGVVTSGNARFVNLTAQTLGVQLGGERAVVAAGAQAQVRLPADALPLSFRVASSDAAGSWTMHVSSVVPPLPEGRALILFCPAAADGSGVRVVTVNHLPQ